MFTVQVNVKNSLSKLKDCYEKINLFLVNKVFMRVY